MQQYTDVEKSIRSQLDTIYARVLAGVDPKDYYNTMIKYDRLNSLLRETQAAYNYHYSISGKTIKQISSMAMNNTFYRQQYILQWANPTNIGLQFTFLDPRVVEVAVTGTAESWKAISEAVAKKYLPAAKLAPQYGTLSKVLLDNKMDDLKKIQRTLTQGFIRGLSNQNMAREIKTAIGTSYGKAERIARTESARTANKATQLSAINAKNQGLDIMRMWLASLDGRTRANHGRMDGKLAEVDGPFENGVMGPGQWPTVKDNVHERCTTINVFLDDNGEAIPPLGRRGKNPVTGKSEVFEWKRFPEWTESNGLKKNKYGELYVK